MLGLLQFPPFPYEKVSTFDDLVCNTYPISLSVYFAIENYLHQLKCMLKLNISYIERFVTRRNLTSQSIL